MEQLLDFIAAYWLYLFFVSFVTTGALMRWLDKDYEPPICFECKKMPLVRPVPIKTKGLPYWKAMWVWLSASRQWRLEDNWYFSINGQGYVIPMGFYFDGINFPPPINTWFLPTGIMLTGSIVHDYAYKHHYLLKANHTHDKILTRKECDVLFRHINTCVNGMRMLNYAGYLLIRLWGLMSWKSGTKRTR